MYLSSGIGTYLQNLLPRLAESVGQERMTLMAGASVLDQLTDCLPRAKVKLLRSKIYTVHEQIEFLVHAPVASTVWWSPHFNIPLGYGGPLVVTVHDLFHLTSSDIRRNPVKLAYATMMFKAVRRRAHKIICVSSFTANEFARLLGSVAGKMEVIPNGVGESWFDPVSEMRPQENSYFLFVGNLKPNKNVTGLIRAFAEIYPRIPHDLVIVGQRSGFITADMHAEKLAQMIGPRVKFTDFLALEDLRRWYRHATALVFPSFYEGFGLPPLEAMAVDCPVIVSNAASLPEVCGDAALYCDPNDISDIARAMLRIVDEPSLRRDLIAKGRARARMFRWGSSAAHTAAVLRSAAPVAC